MYADEFATCLGCDLRVRRYRVKLGGLPKCGLKRAVVFVEDVESPLIQCELCDHLVPNVVICLWCGTQLHPLGWRLGI